MTIGKLVFRNITRRRGRLVFTLLGITIGIGSFVTFLALGGEPQGRDTARGLGPVGQSGGDPQGIVRL